MGGNSSTEHINKTMNDKIAKPETVATASDLMKALPTSDTLRYVKNDTYIADPSLILGRVFYEKSGANKLIPFHTSVSSVVDERSILKAPQTVAELIIDSKLSASVELLSLVSLSASKDEVYEMRVINNAAARLIDRGDEWDTALSKWMDNPLCQQLINNRQVGTISIVTGVVQKYITSKKYRKFEAGAKGGGWGVNVAGNLFMSSSEFQMDIIYGLDLVSFGKADSINDFAENIAAGKKLTMKSELETVRSLFDNMAKTRPSVFRISLD